jgi:hypothetical protein
MSRGRFTLLLVILGVAVAAVAFAGALQVLDDDEPDAPPATSSASDATAPDDGSTAAPTTSTTVAPTEPRWIVVVASERSEASAQTKADAVADLGEPVGVLRSDDYPSLNPGLWVAYAGPYPDPEAASRASDALAAKGVAGTYVRCAGTAEECD